MAKQLKIGIVSKSAHWLLAFLMIALLAIGWFMVGLDFYSPYYYSAPALHYSLGILLFVLLCFKTLWNLTRPLPDHAKALKPIEKLAASLVHLVLILSMFLMPITGYLIITAASTQLSFFGLFDLPILQLGSESIRDLSTFFHTYFGFAIVFLVVIHAAAAIKHKFIDKHATARNMWFK